MFFHFNQNNSGGFFDIDDNVRQCVIVEADNADHANDIAREIGIYFNGISRGRDCECCGDRWYPVWGNGEQDYSSDYVASDADNANIILYLLNGDRAYLRDADSFSY